MHRLILALLLLGAAPASAADLALKRVMLSSAGVGYFEYETEVDGPATLGLDVPLDQVDDVLTSLVVFDSAGAVGTVDLPGRDTTRANFGNVPFGPEALRSAVDYLNSLQGVDISVQGPRPMTGRIVHAEHVAETLPATDGQPKPDRAAYPRHRSQPRGPAPVRAGGGRQHPGHRSRPARAHRPGVRTRCAARPTRACAIVTLHSTGDGHRTVRVGYVAAAPLWKASFRLVLPAKDGDPARLQGWAVLENQSGADWNDVALTLQYGNPVTFRQAIYQSYYVQRPEVPVEILGRILPSVDTRARPAESAMQKAAPAAAEPALRAMAAPAPMPMAANAEPMAPPAEQAEATEAAEQTIFQLPTPVSLAVGHTASVPIIDGDHPRREAGSGGTATTRIRCRRSASPTTPASSIPAGVLTLYDASGAATFAGDARLGGLPAGEQRLLSFAQDLRTTIERSSSGETTLASLTAADGVLHITTRQREVMRVTITGPANEPRQVLVEIPKEGERKLTLEDGAITGTEETATAWRVPIALKPGEVRKTDRLRRPARARANRDTGRRRAGCRAAAQRADIDARGAHARCCGWPRCARTRQRSAR